MKEAWLLPAVMLFTLRMGNFPLPFKSI